jgi:hypothetical protein
MWTKRHSPFFEVCSRIVPEVAAQKSRMLGCSHSRWPSGHKLAGIACPKGQGEWTTGGQLSGTSTNRIVNQVCQRCGTGWLWRPTEQELNYIESTDSGLSGWPPPDESRVLHQCVWCSKQFIQSELKQHEPNCSQRYPRRMVEPLPQAANVGR